MATVMTAALSVTLAAPLALASVVVADAVTIGIHVAGAVGSRRRAISMMGTGAITDAITRAAVIADAVAVGIHVTPPGDGLRGRVRCHGSLPCGQVSHAKRKGRHGKNGA